MKIQTNPFTFVLKTHQLIASQFQITSKLSPLIAVNNSKATGNANKHFNDVRVTEKLWINDSLEQRLDNLITHIFEAKDRSEINNVATSELIELFHYKINLCRNTEKNLLKRLEDANEEVFIHFVCFYSQTIKNAA